MDGFKLCSSTVILWLTIVCSCAQIPVVTLPNFPQTKPFLFPQTTPFFLTTVKATTTTTTPKLVNTDSTAPTPTSKYLTLPPTTKYVDPTTTEYTKPIPTSYTSPTTIKHTDPTTTKYIKPQTSRYTSTTTEYSNPTTSKYTSTTAKYTSTTTEYSSTTAKHTPSTATKYPDPTTTKYSNPVTNSDGSPSTTTTEYTKPTSTSTKYTKPTITAVKLNATTEPWTSTAATTVSAHNSTVQIWTDGFLVFNSENQSTETECSDKNGECGVSSQDKIVGGILASPHEFPWLAHLVINKGSRSALCTGFLVTNRHVITAAHCTKGASDGAVRLTLGTNSPSVDTGSDTASSNDRGSVQLRSVKIVIHPQYNERGNTNDVSVITVDMSVKFTDTVRPICLPLGDDSYAGSTGIIAGWGSISEGGAVTKHLMKATVPILSNRDPICVKAYGNTIRPQMICAGGKHMDTCQGDSGGPLMVSKDGVFTAVGIVSFGIGCGRPATPGIYARITALKSFIEPQISSGRTCDTNGSIPPTN